MRIGQTSFIVFGSKVVTSLLGFLATLYFARVLGAEILGYYSVVLALVSWLKFSGTLGITEAIVKRLSEGESPNEYFSAGVVIASVAAILLSLGVVLLADVVDSYVGANVWYFLIPLLITGLFLNIVRSTLNGTRRVHIAGLLTPTNLIVTSVIQIILVTFDFGLSGLLFGFLAGEVVVATLGTQFLSVSFQRPSISRYRQLYDYAKYSWLSGLKMRAYNDVDILILSALVSPALVGIYAIAWSLARFLTLFGTAVRSAIFPEVSNADASENNQRIEQLTTDSLAFVGLFAIPGLFGGAILADRLLSLYGPEFTQGTLVLVLLIITTLIYSYQQQMMSVINALDRPDVTFKINVTYIVANIFLNVIFVSWIGWVGAAIATVLSVALALSLAFLSLRSLVEFKFPSKELGRQFVAAALMSLIVLASRRLIESTEIIQHNVIIVISLVLTGVAVYFLTLLSISDQFRQVITTNIPGKYSIL